MEEYDNLINDLSDRVGIIPEYYDIFGKKYVIAKESRLAILSAMGLRVGSADEVRSELLSRELRPWLGMLEPVFVISVNAQPFCLPVHVPLAAGQEQAAEISVTIEDERGRTRTVTSAARGLQVDAERVIEGRQYLRLVISLPGLELGYFTITVVCSHPEAIFEGGSRTLRRSARLIVAPDRCHMPEQLRTDRTWGIAVNLYALRSTRNWGIGDLGDLRHLASWAAGLKAGLVGINPLHDIPNTAPFGVSPYLPVTRLYRNFLYIDMERVEELSSIAVPAEIAERIEALRSSERVDYEGVAAIKRAVLEQAFHAFYNSHYRNESPRGRAFREYVAGEGAPLEQYALFLALSEHLGKSGVPASWLDWPEEFRSPDRPAVQSFRKSNEERVLFFAYLQWLIDTQLAEVSASAGAAGLSVGLYGDLAIGAHGGGSDVWMYQDAVAEQMSLGAPPDDFNHNGQDWGFPPLNPDRLRESGYELFIQTIRKNMRHLGAIRIDHAAGLFRLFWIPKGRKPAEGGYVRCRAEDLLRIIALESVRNRTLVVGEDLGTITDEMREGLQRFGMLSYRLFYFERNYPDPSFLPPERYPVMALSAITTHDLPTLYGFWSGRDLDVKGRLGISDGPQLERQKSDRERDRNLMVRALEARGLLKGCPSGDASGIPAMTHDLCCAIYRYLSASPSKIVLVSLDDVVGTMDQQNLPGTVSEYPNWMQKSPVLLEEILVDRRWRELAGLLQQDR